MKKTIYIVSEDGEEINRKTVAYTNKSDAEMHAEYEKYSCIYEINLFDEFPKNKIMYNVKTFGMSTKSISRRIHEENDERVKLIVYDRKLNKEGNVFIGYLGIGIDATVFADDEDQAKEITRSLFINIIHDKHLLKEMIKDFIYNKFSRPNDILFVVDGKQIWLSDCHERITDYIYDNFKKYELL